MVDVEVQVTNPRASQLAEAIERLLANDGIPLMCCARSGRPDCLAGSRARHRVEGDLANARYWYDKAGLTIEDACSVEDEINELREYLAHDR